MNDSQPTDDRIQRALEGLLSVEEHDALKADVIGDATLRAAYVDQLWLHSTLRARRDTLVTLLENPSILELKAVRRWPTALWAAAAAACVTLAVSMAFFGQGILHDRPVATLVQADNCKWAGSDLPTVVDSKLGTGRLALVEGIATLKFKSGATVTIEAPTTLEILTAMHCRLVEGTLTAEVPEPAHGFKIDTPDIQVIDLGTKFGVTTGSTGNSQVRVFEGEVEIDGLADGKPKRLTEGKGMHVGSGNTSLGQEPTPGVQVQEAGGWTAIPTSFGRGKDAYARRGDSGAPLGSQPLIIVKHSDLASSRNNERRAIITFDVSQIATVRISEAQIVLDPEPSGFGFASLVPDSRFAVYGLTDGALDDWNEKEIRWKSLPGCTNEGPNPQAARKLAEFWIPRGGSGGPLTVRADALAEFIRTKTNGLVSFLIVRETGETDSSGLAHAFASKEHPSRALRLAPQMTPRRIAMKHALLFLACLGAAAPLAAEDDAARATSRFFENEVRPVLANRCYQCHSQKKTSGSLRVDNISYLKAGGDSGPALVPGDPDKSIMIEAIRYQNPDFQMPPKARLPDKEIAILEKWIKLGAPWPENEASRVAVDGFGFTNEDRAFWSFQSLAKPTPPNIKSEWVRNDIDRFIAKTHAKLGLTPAPEADRRELVRRLYFGLHGLPPTTAQADAFASSTDPQAYEKLVDELLASPRYGERWAQHWLDLTRYAESDGYNQDAFRPAAWAYRDYVIKSLNADKPYDQFVREQLAGDEIDPKNPDVLVATSYLRNPIYEYNQRDARGQYEVILTDMTDNAGELFLGLSFGCARCHDHKFDPILQKDYYRLRAFFTPVRWRDDLKLATDEEQARFAEQQAKWEAATADIRSQIDTITGPLIEKNVRRAYQRFQDDIRAMVDRRPEERAPQDWQYSYFCERQMRYERERFDALKSIKKPEDKAHYQALLAELKKFDPIKPESLLDAFVATDAMTQGPPNMLQTRKGTMDVAPGFLTLLEPQEPTIEPLPKSTGRRSALAAWITRPNNQLSTRVITNRVWHYLFGRGLVETPNDFGKLGGTPSHPELLDYLTQRFLAGGWSLKKLHREILLSATYRQTAHRAVPEIAAKIDPANKFLWRFNPRRLDAEQVRDAMLAVSGELDLKPGGPSTDGNGTRRSIYTIKKRNSQNELLRSLDAPAGFSSTSERQSTTTPTQALLLVNGDWPLARAQKFASRVSSVEQAWQYALGRPPTAKELALAKAFIAKRVADNVPGSGPSAAAKADASQFKENTPQERLVARTSEKEGDEFTIEAVVKLDSIDTNASVRTIASHWNNGKDNVEAFGWSLGVTGEKSRFKPRNLIIQLVGEDENRNIAYEPVASDLRIELGVTYHVVVKVSCSGHAVTFRVQQVGKPNSPVLTSVAPHGVRTGLSDGASGLVIGGVNKRAPTHQWDGRIEAARVVRGLLPEEAFSPDPANWAETAVVAWKATPARRNSLPGPAPRVPRKR